MGDSAARKRAWRRRYEIRDETIPRDEKRDEIPGGGLDGAGNLRVRLFDASQGNADFAADVAPIVAREVRDLPAR